VREVKSGAGADFWEPERVRISCADEIRALRTGDGFVLRRSGLGVRPSLHARDCKLLRFRI